MNSHEASFLVSSLLSNAHNEAPPIETPPFEPSTTLGKYAVPTSNLPLTSWRICFKEAVDPKVIADLPAEKSAIPASPPRPTFAVHPLS